MPAPRSGNRVIALLGVLLLAAIALVAWLALRGEPAPTPVKPPAAAPRTRPAEPVAPRPGKPREVETVPYEPAAPTKPAAPEESEETPKPLKLEVDVFGTNGLAAPGATVILVNPLLTNVAADDAAEIARGSTDAFGVARFDVTGRTIRAFAWLGADAGASDKFRPTPTRARVAVRLAPGVPVKGRVVEAVGERPVVGATVRLVAKPWYQDIFGLAVETKSAELGAFELPPIPASAFESMTGGAATVEARAKGWPTGSVSVTAEVLCAGEVVVRLDRGAFLRGRFVRPTGEGIYRQEVRLVDGRSVVESEIGGRFELPLPREGGAVVAVHSPSVGSRSMSSIPLPTGWGAPKLLGRFRGDGGDVDLGDVTLDEGKPVTGVVVDLDEKPVRAAEVVLSLGGVVVNGAQTDDRGRFEIEFVGDDAHSLTALEPPGENSAVGRRHATVDGVRGGAADVRVQLTGALTVVVKFLADADRSPVVVSEVVLKVVPADPTARGYRQQFVGAGIDSARLEMERAGRYDVTIDVPGYETGTASGVEVDPDREARIEVLFRKRQ